MKKVRILSLLLVLVMMLGALASCNLFDGGQSNIDGGNRDEEGGWDGVDFKGQEVKICISTNKYEECNFPAADIYTRGPDTAGSNEVTKEVLARNQRAGEDLNIKIVYSERDLRYPQVHEDIRTTVQTSAKNAPDIYNNDLLGLARAMVDGLLWNIKNPGDESMKTYFDMSTKGWYAEFMKGCTFDQEKLYIFAGDYFIDMIRMAWVIYVNNDILSQSIGKMPSWCTDVTTFYEYVDAGYWDMDLLADMSARAFVDGAGGTMGETELEDQIIGFTMNHVTNWVLSDASGVTLYYQDKENNYKPMVMDSIDTYQRVSNKYIALLESTGVYMEPNGDVEGVLNSTKHFMEGNVLFAVSRLGEMESTELRDFSAAKGLVPMPKWEDNEQDEYHTTIHNQVELGVILNTSKAYSAATALMQYLNEESDLVINAYYEKGLKYKYNSDKIARAMMDLVRETSDSPFSFEIGDISQELYTGNPALKGLYIKDNATISSTFASEKDAYVDCMNKMIEKFSKLK